MSDLLGLKDKLTYEEAEKRLKTVFPGLKGEILDLSTHFTFRN